MTDQRRSRYPLELRDRAVRMVFEAERYCGSQWEAIVSVADKLGPTAEAEPHRVSCRLGGVSRGRLV